MEVVASLSNWAHSTRAALRDNGVLDESEGALVFTQDYGFEYPSQAAAIVSGSTGNKSLWRLADGRTFKQWEQEQLDAAEAKVASARAVTPPP